MTTTRGLRSTEFAKSPNRTCSGSGFFYDSADSPSRPPMNYLAHALRYLDRPWFAAGTAVPDWLSVADRQVRVRSRILEPIVETLGSHEEREIAYGILQHPSATTSGSTPRPGSPWRRTASRQPSEQLDPDPDFPASFLGHVVSWSCSSTSP